MTVASYKLKLTSDEVMTFVAEVFPESNKYGFKIKHLVPGKLILTMSIRPEDLRPGGTVSGPTMFCLADIAAYILILSHIGRVELAVTTSVNINFVRKPEPIYIQAVCTFIKLGKRLAICDILIQSGRNLKTVAQACATYSIPPLALKPMQDSQ